MKHIASFLTLLSPRPPLLLLLLPLLPLLLPGPALALYTDCLADITISGDEDMAPIIYTRQLELGSTAFGTWLYTQPSPDLRGLSVEMVSGGGDVLDASLITFKDACLKRSHDWMSLWVLVDEREHIKNGTQFSVHIGNCWDVCVTHGSIKKAAGLQFRAHGASRWKFRRPDSGCGTVSDTTGPFPLGPHPKCQRPKTTKQEYSTSTPPSHVGKANSSSFTVVWLVVVVVGVVVALLVVVVVVVLVVQRQQRQLKPTEAPIYNEIELEPRRATTSGPALSPRQGVDASSGMRGQTVDEDNIYDEINDEPRRTPRRENTSVARNVPLYDDVVFDDDIYLTPLKRATEQRRAPPRHEDDYLAMDVPLYDDVVFDDGATYLIPRLIPPGTQPRVMED